MQREEIWPPYAVTATGSAALRIFLALEVD